MGKSLAKGYNWQALGMVRPQLEVQKMTWEFCNVLWFWTLFNLKDYRKRIWDKKKVHLPSQLAQLETKNKYLTRGYTGPTRNLPFGKTLTISAISAWLDNGPIGPFPWQGTVHWPRPPQPHEELTWRHRIRVIHSDPFVVESFSFFLWHRMNIEWYWEDVQFRH